jgi:hypothetical protein
MGAALARSAQLAELVRGGLAGGQHHDEVLLVVAGRGEFDVIQEGRARDRVPESLAVGVESLRSVLLPEFGELGAGRAMTTSSATSPSDKNESRLFAAGDTFLTLLSPRCGIC